MSACIICDICIELHHEVREPQRGCTKYCGFCQGGFRPVVRVRSDHSTLRRRVKPPTGIVALEN